MELKDFVTLELAQDHEVITYKEITVGAATQFFGLTGLLDNLEASSADTTPIVLSESMTTTVGALCRTILNSAKTTGFVADPNTNDGAINRAASQMLVAAGVFTQPLVDAFWAKSVVVTKPYEGITKHEYQVSCNTVTLKPAPRIGNYVVIETNADCEKHNPRLVGTRTNPRTDKVEIQRINNFYGVSETGKYETKVPNEWLDAELFVDDAYGVII